MPRTTNIPTPVVTKRTPAKVPSVSNTPKAESVPITTAFNEAKPRPTENPVLDAILSVCEDKLAQLRLILSNPKKNAADEKNDMYKRGLSMSEGAMLRGLCSGVGTELIQSAWREAIYMQKGE